VRRLLLAPALVPALVVALLVGGCSDDEPSSAPSPAPGSSTTSSSAPSASETPSEATPTAQYVALGDSYAAAPGVPPADTAADAATCFRSAANYAHLLAEAEGLDLVDATCSGATSGDVLDEQLASVQPTTELVTVGIGGNDFDLFTQLIASCIGAAQSDPTGSPCTDAVAADVTTTLPRIGKNVGRVLDAVTAAAPDAQVVVVGYPTLLPPTGSCPDRVPLAAGDYPFVNEVTSGLSGELRRAARQRGLTFVDLAGPSRGHDICSTDPWVNGAATAPDGTIPFHPFAAEQEAVARLVARVL
jgi:lysophospholipase L1-like esterase